MILMLALVRLKNVLNSIINISKHLRWLGVFVGVYSISGKGNLRIYGKYVFVLMMPDRCVSVCVCVQGI